MNELRIWDAMSTHGARRVLWISDPPSGLRAIVALDSLTLGPAVGGIRTRRYPSTAAALADATALARAMTIKNALAGLPAGGGKIVVMDHEALDRPAAFRALGRHLQDLGGLMRTAGDLGTTVDDLRAAASCCDFVHIDSGDLSAAVARGWLACARALADHRGVDLRGLRVAIQGVGAIGAAVARVAKGAGLRPLIADLDGARAHALSQELTIPTCPPDELLTADIDLLAPCAVGGVLTLASLPLIRAWGVIPAANNSFATPEAADFAHALGRVVVPDFIASAGAVIEGILRTVAGIEDADIRGRQIDALGGVSSEILARSTAENRAPSRVAMDRADSIISAKTGYQRQASKAVPLG